MSNVDGVLLVLTMMTEPRVSLAGVAAEVRRGQAVADIASETGIRQLVYSLINGADLIGWKPASPSGEPTHDSEEA